ncbi:MAG TPA: hypothetical protein VKB65_10800, partial [Myxococcota bacterium]|nr:hypothetical protein [Myxococcota bacterium]
MQHTARRGLIGLILGLAAFQMGPACQPPPNARPGIGSQLFTSPQANPIALSTDGQTLYVANTTAGQVTLIDANPPYDILGVFPVGLDPVGIAVKPKALPSDDEILLVTNHLSDSISVLKPAAGGVTQTIQ